MKKKFMLLFYILIALIMGCTVQERNAGGYRVGDYTLNVLIENEGTGSTEIFLDASADVLERYAPDGTFPNAVNAVLLRKGSEVWLVDTGFGRNIFEQMDSLGVSAADVDHIVLTHMHIDHISGMLRDDKPAFPNADVRVSEKEYRYWNSRDEMMNFPETMRGNFVLAQRVIQEYGDRIKIENPRPVGGDFADGIHMLEAYGHSPGHVAYLIKDGDDKFLIWGDLTHAVTLQTAHPEICVRYDYAPDNACESRKKILEYVSTEGIPVAGMHVPFGGIGSVKKSAEGYLFIPLAGKY